MYKLIIVDDELLVRLGIKSYIESGSQDYEIAGTFANGQEALDYCISSMPDIVLTDIVMPVMDGLQLIERLKKIYPQIKIVVLSCHEEYKLVKSAFKLGADDYVLKHEVEMEELIKVIDKVMADVPSAGEILQPEKNIRAEKDIIINTLLNWDEGQPYPDSLNEKINKYHMRLFPSNIMVICMTIINEYDEKFRKIEKNIDVLPVINTINEIFNKYYTGEVFLKGNTEFAGILCFSSENSERKIKERLFSIIEDIKAFIKKIFNCDVSIGVSNIYNSLSNIRKAYLEAHEAVLFGFYRGKGSTVYFNEVVNYRETNYNLDIKSVKEVVINKVNYSFNSSGILEVINRYFDDIMDGRYISPDVLKKEINTVIYVISDFIHDYFDLRVEQVFGNDFVAYKQIGQIDNIYTLKQWIIFFIEEIDKKIREKSKDVPLIARIKEYIEKHYSEDLSLKTISEAFYMNMNYFCQFFKKETGKNFIEYLTNLRIEKAKMYLKLENLSAMETAEKVGFKNVNYFMKVFKKVTGLNISEYKKS